MAACKVKPVQPTEIRDKKIIREVIAQIRKPIPAKIQKRTFQYIQSGKTHTLDLRLRVEALI